MQRLLLTGTLRPCRWYYGWSLRPLISHHFPSGVSKEKCHAFSDYISAVERTDSANKKLKASSEPFDTLATHIQYSASEESMFDVPELLSRLTSPEIGSNVSITNLDCLDEISGFKLRKKPAYICKDVLRFVGVVYNELHKKNGTWLCPHSRQTAFVQITQNDSYYKLASFGAVRNSSKVLELVQNVEDSVHLFNTPDAAQIFLDLTHLGLDGSNPVFGKLEGKLKNSISDLNFISLGKFILARKNITREKATAEQLLQLQSLLRSSEALVKYGENPGEFLHACSEYSSSGLMQKLEPACLQNMSKQILSVLSNVALSENLNFIVPVLDVISTLLFGDEELVFLDPLVRDTAHKIFVTTKEVMNTNMDKLTLHQLGAILKMTGEEHLSVFSGDFLSSMQNNIEQHLSNQDLSQYNVVELLRLVILPWVILSEESENRLKDVLKDYLVDWRDVTVIPEIITYLIKSKMVSAVMFDSKFHHIWTNLFLGALLRVDMIDILGNEEFCKYIDIIKTCMKKSEKVVMFETLYQKFKKDDPVLQMKYSKVQQMCYFLLSVDRITAETSCLIPEPNLLSNSSLYDIARFFNCVSLGNHKMVAGNLHVHLTAGVTNNLTKRFSDKILHQLFLLGPPEKNENTLADNEVRYSGIPSPRLLEKHKYISKAFSSVIPSYTVQCMEALSEMCYCATDFDMHSFEMACSLILSSVHHRCEGKLANFLLHFFMENKEAMTTKNYKDMLQIIYHVRPTDSMTFQLKVLMTKYIKENMDTLDIGDVFQMLYHLSLMNWYPKNIIQGVFQKSSIERLRDLLDGSGMPYSDTKNLIHNVAKLNQAIHILQPALRVPLLSDLVKVHHNLEPDAKKKHDSFVRRLHTLLAEKIGGPEFLQINVTEKALINIDLVITCDVHGNPVKMSDYRYGKGKHYTRWAVVCQEPNNVFGKRFSFTRETWQKWALLTTLKYRVLVVDYFMCKEVDYMENVVSSMCKKMSTPYNGGSWQDI